MIARFLGNLLSIKSNEWEGVLNFFLVLLVFSFGFSFARSISMALLVGELGGNKLPIMYILIDLTAMMGFIRYAHYTNKFSGLSILKFLLLSTALFSVIAQLLFLLTAYWLPEQKWVYGFFFVGSSFFFIIISIHIGTVVASYFTAYQAKRVTHIINAGIPIGSILGGSSLLILLKIFQVEPQYLVGMFSGACFCAFLLVRIVDRFSSPVRIGETQMKGSKNPLRELMSAFKYTLASKLMIFMSLCLILFVITQKFLEYQYQTVIYVIVYKSVAERTAFFATYEIFANLALFFFQLFFTSRIVMAMGVGASNLVYPVLSTLAALALFIYFFGKALNPILDNSSMTIMLILGIVTQFINQEMRWALRTPTNNFLFNAIPPALWGSNKAFLNGIVFPLSTLMASALLIFIMGNHAEPPVATSLDNPIYYILPLIALIVSLLGIAAAVPQWAAYNKDMFESLNRRLFDPRLEKINSKASNSLKQMIQQNLSSPDPYHVIVVLEMIRVLRLNDFVNQVGNLLLKTQDFQIKKHCISTIAAFPQSQSNLTYLVEALQTEKDANVLPLILKELAQFQSVNLNDTIEKLLTHPSPLVFVEACLCLHAHPKYSRKHLIENRILGRIENSNQSKDTALYLYALGELQQPHHSNIVLPFFKNEKSEVRVAAFTAYVHMLEGQLETYKPCLIEALNSPDKEIKIVALKALKECKSLEDWSPIIRLLGERDRTVVTESKELLRLNLNICRSAFIEYMFSDQMSVQQRFEILSLIYPKLNNEQRKRLQRGADEALKKFIQVNALLKLHESKEHNSKADDLITKILQEIAESHLLHTLTVITFVSEQNIEFFQRVNHGLFSSNRANQGNALEVLSNAREKYLADRVLKYFEERANNIQTIRRIYSTLFNDSLEIDNNCYESQLFALDHDMLKACLFYTGREKTGKLRLNNTNENVRRLLT